MNIFNNEYFFLRSIFSSSQKISSSNRKFIYRNAMSKFDILTRFHFMKDCTMGKSYYIFFAKKINSNCNKKIKTSFIYIYKKHVYSCKQR